MRGIGISFSRLFSPKAIIAGAAILAGTAAPGLHADAQEKTATENNLNDQRAYAVPRADPDSSSGFAFPQPLNPSDAVLVRRIFALQSHGNIAAAEQATRQLSNRILLGTILADRYTGPYDKPTAPELIQWLKLYGDQPQAPAIENVLRLRLRGKRGPTAVPKLQSLPYLAPPDPNQSADLDIGPADTGVARQPGLDARVLALSQSGNLDGAVRVIAAAPIDALYGATLRAEVARTAFAEGKNAVAARMARDAMQECHDKLGLPAFVAGLAAWRMGKPEATTLFATAASAPRASQNLAAAAAFWAARSSLRMGQDMGYLSWMRRAANSGIGFYAVLAAHMLGEDASGSALGRETLGLADLEAVAANPHGERAFALLQVGQTHLAEQELRALYPTIAQDPGLRRAVMLIAWHAGLAPLANQIASLDPSRPSGSAVVIPPRSLLPKHGLRVDPSLLYALVRVESNFDPKAVSSAGAEGLLQLMPATAEFMDKTRGARRPGTLSDSSPRAGRSLSTTRSASSRTSSTRSPPRTARSWSTATSSRRTSCSPPTDGSRSPTSVSPVR